MKKNRKRRRLWIKAALSASLGFAAALWGIPRGCAERGCCTAGGEHLLILVAVLLPFLLSPELWRR